MNKAHKCQPQEVIAANQRMAKAALHYFRLYEEGGGEINLFYALSLTMT